MPGKTEQGQEARHDRIGPFAQIIALLLCVAALSCGGGAGSSAAATPRNPANPLGSYQLAGDVKYVHDPSIYQQGGNWYLFSTDYNNPGGHLPVRCSSDLKNYHLCGFIFPEVPAWIRQRFPNLVDLW